MLEYVVAGEDAKKLQTIVIQLRELHNVINNTKKQIEFLEFEQRQLLDKIRRENAEQSE